ncbi:homeobox and leucine zipper encoding b [Osmerus eperlanus]|uniref:homeobox and leucine zipper encoding b n=1 Tax=Osmerus eperlanus TaxID=29151 RepID=UPI002E0EDE79
MTSAPEATELWFPVCQEKTERLTSKPKTIFGDNGPNQVSTLDQPLPTVWERGQESVDPTLTTFRFNQNHVVCLPVVTENLRLIWARSEQKTQQIGRDAVSELEKHFDIFPYPTLPEMTTLALRYLLHPDQVRVWFMTQRLCYGISWDCEEICEARTKLFGCQSEKEVTGKEKIVPKQYCMPVRTDRGNLKKLRHCFQQTQKPSEEQLFSLHKETGLSMKNIRKWFNNQRFQKRSRERIFSQILTSPPHQSEAGDLTGSTAKSSSDDGVGATSSVNLADVSPADSKCEGCTKKCPELPVQAASQETLGVFPYGSHGDDGSVSDSWKNETRQEAVDEIPSPTDVEGEPVAPLPPVPQAVPPSPGSSERGYRQRNKTLLQLQLLRETFMILQWPTAEDYDGLQRLTGLTRRQLTQWFGDMRYHVKQGMARWIRPEERVKVLARVTRGPGRRRGRRKKALEMDVGPDSDLSDVHQMLSRFLPSLDG